MEPNAVALCAKHREAPATFTCERCGAFGCPACTSLLEGVCAACFGVHSERLGVSGQAWTAFAFALLAFHGAFPLAGVALWLAYREGAAIARRDAPRGGLPLLQGVKWLSVLALLVWPLAWWLMLRE